jgi:hypothetical protein
MQHRRFAAGLIALALVIGAAAALPPKSVRMRWEPPTECLDGAPIEAIKSFIIYRNGERYAEVPGDQVQIVMREELTQPGERHCYRVSALANCADRPRLESPPSRVGCKAYQGEGIIYPTTTELEGAAVVIKTTR